MLNKSIKAIVSSILKHKKISINEESEKKIAKLVIAQIKKMPDYYRYGVIYMTYLLIAYGLLLGGNLLYKMKDMNKVYTLKSWSSSRIPMSGLLLELYEKLSVFGAHSEV